MPASIPSISMLTNFLLNVLKYVDVTNPILLDGSENLNRSFLVDLTLLNFQPLTYWIS